MLFHGENGQGGAYVVLTKGEIDSATEPADRVPVLQPHASGETMEP